MSIEEKVDECPTAQQDVSESGQCRFHENEGECYRKMFPLPNSQIAPCGPCSNIV